MNWDDMRVFLAVARAQSLSGAAPRLKMDPATVGRRIVRLEDAAGATLFVKSPQGYALTDLGTRMHDHAVQAEAAMLAVEDEAQGDRAGQGRQGALTGQIRIGAPDGAANYLLPQVCAAIGRDHPDLDIQILALPRVVNLSQREADMAVTVSPPQATRLNVEKICDYHLHLATLKGHEITTPADLKDAPLVGYIPDMIFDKELDYLSDLGVNRVPLASNSVAVQVMALRAGAGVGFVHDFALPFAPELTRVLSDHISLRRSFHLVRHGSDLRSDRLNHVARLFSDGVRAEVARLEGLVNAEQLG